jgi:hypothetical protein
VHFAEDSLRFLSILFIAIPALALSFMALGMLFHAPRTATSFACTLATRGKNQIATIAMKKNCRSN